MHPYTAAVYEARSPGLPPLAVIFKNGKVAACFEAESISHAESYLERALEWLPAMDKGDGAICHDSLERLRASR